MLWGLEFTHRSTRHGFYLVCLSVFEHVCEWGWGRNICSLREAWDQHRNQALHTSNSNIRKGEARGSEAHDHTQLHSELQASLNHGRSCRKG